MTERQALPLLQAAPVIGGYRMPYGSNYTFMVHLDAGEGNCIRAIYKPRDGERPLYDYPSGTLYQRERATFILSRALGWPNVPYTLLREGPYGIGSMQMYIDCDPETTYFDLIERNADELAKFAVFDLVVNNGDRKAGHCLQDDDGVLWSIDHGLTFHPAFKLRTVMIEFWGKPIPDALAADLERLLSALESPDDDLPNLLADLITPQEMQSLTQRLEFALRQRALPMLDPYRNVPWPWV